MTLRPEDSGLAEAPASVIAAQLDWHAAWDRVSTKSGMPGVDGVSISRFGKGVPASLRVLEAQLASGEYRPLPLRLATLLKKDGGTRTLLVPAVRDRVAQTALAAWLGSKWDATFDRASFAYRPGLGVHAALRLIRDFHDRGARWVFDADIKSCFDSIDHARLFDRVRCSLGRRSPVAEWVRAWTAADVWDGAEIRRVARGVPQGSPLSPLLANFYMDAFDRDLRAADLWFVRYADDFLVVAPTPFDLQAHVGVVHAALARLGLLLNAAKTRVTTFEQRFRFVGAEIRSDAILLPFEKKKTKLRATFVAERMPPAVLRMWWSGHLHPTGTFSPVSAASATSPACAAPIQAWLQGLSKLATRSLERLRSRS